MQRLFYYFNKIYAILRKRLRLAAESAVWGPPQFFGFPGRRICFLYTNIPGTLDFWAKALYNIGYC